MLPKLSSSSSKLTDKENGRLRLLVGRNYCGPVFSRDAQLDAPAERARGIDQPSAK